MKTLVDIWYEVSSIKGYAIPHNSAFPFCASELGNDMIVSGYDIIQDLFVITSYAMGNTIVDQDVFLNPQNKLYELVDALNETRIETGLSPTMTGTLPNILAFLKQFGVDDKPFVFKYGDDPNEYHLLVDGDNTFYGAWGIDKPAVNVVSDWFNSITLIDWFESETVTVVLRKPCICPKENFSFNPIGCLCGGI